MIVKQALEFAIEQVASLVASPRVDEALRLIIPQILQLSELDRFDAQARGQVQAVIDDALRSVNLIPGES